MLPSASHSAMYARRSNATRVFFEPYFLENPPMEGTFKLVTLGKFTAGRCKGETAVGKWTKDLGCDESDDLLRAEVRVAQKALQIVAAFNLTSIYKKNVFVIIPEVWRVTRSIRDHWIDVEFLIEPFLESFRKFNSNKNWFTDDTESAKAMQSLSHFSYHISGGRYVLCDLQGADLQNEVVLTDPAIHSTDFEFGQSDRGLKGMLDFFATHVCNPFCSTYWSKPILDGKSTPNR